MFIQGALEIFSFFSASEKYFPVTQSQKNYNGIYGTLGQFR